MRKKTTKRSVMIRILQLVGFVISTLFTVLVATAVFFLTARITASIMLMVVTAVLSLLLTATGAAWLLTRSLPISASYAVAVLLLTASLTYAYGFRPLQVVAQPVQPRADTHYWKLSTGSHLGYTHFPAVGTPHATPIVYLHGGPAVPTRAANYDFFQQLAQDGYDVYLYDQLGTGLSDDAPDITAYTLERNVADLEAIRVEIGADQLVLAGTSWGAVLAANYMASYPDHVATAILMSPGVLGDRSQVRYDYSLTASADDDSVILPPLRMIMAGALARINPEAAQRFAPQTELNAIYDSFVTSPSIEYQVNCRGYQPNTAQPARSGGGNYYANLLTLESLKRAPDPGPKLQTNQTPVLIMRGECDYIPWESTYRYKQLFSQSVLLIIPDAGHALTSSQPDLTLAAVRAFLTEQPLPLLPYESDQKPTALNG